MIKELPYIIASILVVIFTIIANTAYTAHEKRKAYYACLQVVEKVAQEQQKQSNGSVRIVALPFCSH
jgi:hypothetical protein